MFKAKVIAVVKAIPKGKTMTYGEVAKSAGSPRAVGIIMKQNKDKKIPCHRVVARSGLGGYNGLRGESKSVLLKQEGVRI
ncbi:MAG: MGMT family protein [Candidatus Paceibacterota bacterium]